jgi:hypothetical protein
MHALTPAAHSLETSPFRGFSKRAQALLYRERRAAKAWLGQTTQSAPGTKASALKGCAFFIYLTLRDVRGKA